MTEPTSNQRQPKPAIADDFAAAVTDRNPAAERIRVEILNNLEQVDRDQWEELWKSDPTATVFQTYSWYAAWLQHFGTEVEQRILLVWGQDRLVGACPLCITLQQRFGIIRRRILTFISSHSAVHALDQAPICAPDQEEKVLYILAQAIQGMRGFTAFHCELFEQDSRTHRLLSRLGDVLRRSVTSSPSILSHVVILPDSFEELVKQRLSWTRRRTLRKTCRKFDRNSDRIELRTALTEPDLHLLVAAMGQHKGERFKARGARSTLDDQRFVAFLKTVSPVLAAEGRAIGWIALVDGKPAATELAFFDEHGHFFPYNTSFDLQFSKLRLNYVIESARFTEAIQRGYDHLDLSTGLSEYKVHWTKGNGRELHFGEIIVHRLANVLFWMLTRARRLLREEGPS